MRVLYHFPHINHHQNIYSVPQWNIVGACVMAHAYDASARVLLTKKIRRSGSSSLGLQKKTRDWN